MLLQNLLTFFYFIGGPKNYGYQTWIPTGKTCCKLREFTLNYWNSQSLNFELIKRLIQEMETEETIIPITNPQKISRDPKKHKVMNRVETKLYRVFYDKRAIQSDLTTLPYGY